MDAPGLCPAYLQLLPQLKKTIVLSPFAALLVPSTVLSAQ